MGLIRLLVLAWGLYFFFLLAFPEWTSAAYHIAALGAACFGASAVFVFLRVLRVRSVLVTLAYEGGFLAAMAMALLYTWPCRPSALQQFGQGYRPTRAQARLGVKRLGLDPDAGLGGAAVSLFPKR